MSTVESEHQARGYREYFASWTINKGAEPGQEVGVLFDKATRRLAGLPTATNRTPMDSSTKPMQYVGRQGTEATSANLRTTQQIPAFMVEALREECRTK